MRAAVFALVAALAAPLAAPLAAQGFRLAPRVQPELRAEVAVARNVAALVMAGVNVPLGFYVRAGAAVGAGTAWHDGGGRLAARADVTLRFLLDPFGENRWGPYVGGGLTARRDTPDRAAAGLLLVLGVEARRGKRWTPAAEVSLGEGARLAVVLRRSRQNGR